MMQKKTTILVSLFTLFFNNSNAYNHLTISFHDSMGASRNYRKNLVDQYKNWQRSNELYDTYILNKMEVSNQPRIPKIIHQIWLGSPFPEASKKLQESWKRNNPDWQYILWTEHEIEEFELVNKYQYDAAINYGEKSDIARYEILYRMGGLYIDTDFECLKPFDILHNCCDFYAGIAYETKYEVYNGLIGSKPGHQILKDCIDNIKHNIPNQGDILDRTGPYLFTRSIEKHISHYDDYTVLFPVTYFYPWPSYHVSKNSPSDDIKEESFAVHHWHMSWFKGSPHYNAHPKTNN